MGILDDLISSGDDSVTYATPTDSGFTYDESYPYGVAGGNQFGSQLYDAIYAFGRGKVDAARTKIVGAFLNTGEGQKLQAEATRQTATKYTPLIVGAVIVVLILGIMLGKR